MRYTLRYTLRLNMSHFLISETQKECCFEIELQFMLDRTKITRFRNKNSDLYSVYFLVAINIVCFS